MTTSPAPTAGTVLRVALRATIVLAVASALVVVEVTSRSGVAWRLITFTYQANILAAAYYAWTLFSPRADARTGCAAPSCSTSSSQAWSGTCSSTGRSMGYTPANFLLHVVVPCSRSPTGSWSAGATGRSVGKWWHPLAWLAYPAAYLGVALVVLNRVGRRAPYYFLDPGSVGIAAVAVNVPSSRSASRARYLLLAAAAPRSANT